MSKKTLVLGASINPERTSFQAIERLRKKGHEVVAIGLKTGEVADVKIQTDRPDFEKIDTVTLYLNADRQRDYYDYLLSLHPKRIIFNPGAENMELYRLAKAAGIQPDIACTLVLLSLDDY